MGVTTLIPIDLTASYHYRIRNLIYTDYMPIIHKEGLTFYNALLYHCDEKGHAFPSQRLVANHTGMGAKTIRAYSALLDWLELVTAEKRVHKGRDKHFYMIWEPQPVTPELLANARLNLVRAKQSHEFTFPRGFENKILRGFDNWTRLSDRRAKPDNAQKVQPTMMRLDTTNALQWLSELGFSDDAIGLILKRHRPQASYIVAFVYDMARRGNVRNAVGQLRSNIQNRNQPSKNALDLASRYATADAAERHQLTHDDSQIARTLMQAYGTIDPIALIKRI